MEADGKVSFKRRSKGKNVRKRARSPCASEEPPSKLSNVNNGSASEDAEYSERLPLGAGGTRRPASSGRISWRDEYQTSRGAGKDEAAVLATAGRPEIDEADETNVETKRNHDAEREPAKPKKAFGPLRAPTHIRTSIVTDMQPDVCKDYKETGYCGFGDACKFLHDRGVYKAGWQLDKDWAAVQDERRRAVERGEDPDAPKVESTEDVGEDGLPFACFICRKGFKDPVVTLCLHYFCESCALSRMATDTTCAVCKKQLRGVLNTAHKIVAKLGHAKV